jgi:hypothetical protein
VTRPSVDGGRDAIGKYRVGPISDPISLDFALEAKCYGPNNGVGVKELSRLISRLRHREFGILVTTSFVSQQAYQELRIAVIPTGTGGLTHGQVTVKRHAVRLEH